MKERALEASPDRLIGEKTEAHQMLVEVTQSFWEVAAWSGQHWRALLLTAMLSVTMGWAKDAKADGPVIIVDQDVLVNPSWASQNMSTFSEQPGDLLDTGSEPRWTRWSGVCSRAQGQQPTCYQTTSIGWW